MFLIGIQLYLKTQKYFIVRLGPRLLNYSLIL